MQRRNIPGAMLALATCLMFVVGAEAAENKAETKPDYLKVVTAYADTLIEHGRDTYGKVHSPLFAAALDRHRQPPGLTVGELDPVARPPVPSRELHVVEKHEDVHLVAAVQQAGDLRLDERLRAAREWADDRGDPERR